MCCPDCSLQVNFSIGSEAAPWLGKRNYKSLTQAADESSWSRLWGGVHFHSADTDGLTLGRLVASKVFDRVPPANQSKVAAAGPAPKVVQASGHRRGLKEKKRI